MGNLRRIDARPYHLLRPLKTLTFPQTAIFIQVAPLVERVDHDTTRHTFRMAALSRVRFSAGSVVDVLDYQANDAASALEWISRRASHDRSTWVFSHGLAYSLTLLGLWDRLGRSGLEYVFGVLEDPPTILLTRSGRKVLRWVDTLNYWRVPIRELKGAVSLGDITPPANDAPVADWAFHARRKLSVIRRCVCQMIESLALNQVSGLRSTAASTSWAAYRTSFVTTPIYIHGHPAASSLERDTLFGGHASATRIGHVKTPTTALDVNSLYPQMMLEHPHPNKLVSYQEEATVRELHQALQGFHCVADVNLLAHAPGLPRRDRGLVSFDGSASKYSLGGVDLAMAVRDGMVCSVGRLARYESGDLFSAFVRSCYSSKLEAQVKGDFAARLLWKMLMNGLCGKFAQRKRGWIDDAKIFCPDRWGFFWHLSAQDQTVQRARAVAGRAQVLVDRGEPRDSFPAITAGVTGLARQRLRALCTDAGLSNVHYFDTDCMHLGEQGISSLLGSGARIGTGLGDLKEVCSGQDAYYWNVKHYRVGDYWVSNVIQSDAEQVADGVYLQEARAGLAVTLTSPGRDSVRVKNRQVTVRTGPGAYRPTFQRRA